MMSGAGRVTAVVPAAGASRRFGSPKLLADLGGEPLLQHTLRSLLTGGVGRVLLVTSPAQDLAPVALLRDPRVTALVNLTPDHGMFSSIQTGLAAAEADGPVVVLPADMPFVRPETVAAVIAESQKCGQPVVASCGDRTGHPVVLPSAVWRSLLAHRVDSSLKAALVAERIVLQPLEVDDPGILRDVDERRDLAPPLHGT